MTTFVSAVVLLVAALILSIACGAARKVVIHEVVAQVPLLAARLVLSAAQRLPESERERY